MSPADLGRFVKAQDPVYAKVIAELRAGRKRSHWMWFIFPQLRGLGLSAMAFEYGITGLDEAQAYLAHPVLGPRLRECTQLLMEVEGRTIREILGTPDDLKFRSCLTLFQSADPSGEFFLGALAKYYEGVADFQTLELLARLMAPPAADLLAE